MLPKIKEEDFLGDRLKRRREERGFSIEDFADEMQIPPKYIKALEEGSYEVFSARVYAQGYLKKILAALSLNEEELLFQKFNNEWEVRMFDKRSEVIPLPENRGTKPYLTPKIIGLGVLGTAFFLLVMFFAIRLIGFWGSPRLLIKEPETHTVLTEPKIRVRGSSEKEGRLTVNGREIRMDGSGNFDEYIELLAGLNTLEFLLESRFGKISKETRYILVK